MKAIKIITTLVLMFLLSSASYAQDLAKTGTTAAQFLKIGVGSRAIGMGGAYTATSNDLTSIYWNPAGLAANYNNEAFFSHANWIADVSSDFAAFSSYVPGLGTLGAFVNVLSMDEMLIRTIEQPEGTGEFFNAGAIAIGLSYARNLTDHFSIGFNAKYINEYIWHESATGIAIDIGTMYKIDILNEFRLAASVSNFGTKMKMDGRDITEVQQVGTGDGNLINMDIQLEEWDLPLLFRFGMAADVVQTSDMRLTLAVDAIHPNDHTEHINTGIEYSWKEIVYIRGGYSSLFERDTEKGLTLGFGLHYRIMDMANVMIDYAYMDFGRLEEVHYFTVGMKF